jgi:ATP-binding cassette subfamily B protein
VFKLLRYLRPYGGWILLLLVLVLAQVACDLQLPQYMAAIVDEGIMLRDLSVIHAEGLKMLLVALVSMACTVVVGYIAARVGSGFSMRIRGDVFAKVESFSMAEFERFSTASLITRSTNDVQQVQMVVILGLRMFISAPLTGVYAIIKALEMGRELTWVMLVAVLAVTCVVVALFFVAVPRFKLMQKKVDRLNLVTRENLTGLRVIRAFNTQAREEQKFDDANRDLMKINLFVNRLMALMFPFMMMVMNVTTISIIWLGAHAMENGGMMVGDMMAFIQYTMQVIMSFLMITMVFIMFPRASVSGDRIAQVLATENTIADPADPKRGDDALRGVVTFQNVSFRYPDAEEAVLEDITFTAEAGKTTAFIGSTGSGKSTLINLIPRFYDVSSGQVLVDGVDVRDLTMDDLRAKLGYVPQKAVLFSGTVSTNLRFGEPGATDEQVQQAAQTAQAAEFIEKLEEGYDAPIAQGGQNVSGGQKQRLSIARAVVREPEIYLFDDSFSALDFRTDAALRRALNEQTKGATVLIVAQRISTILSADRIVVLDRGRVAGIGTHRELMESCEVYREIALSQLSQEELA